LAVDRAGGEAAACACGGLDVKSNPGHAAALPSELGVHTSPVDVPGVRIGAESRLTVSIASLSCWNTVSSSMPDKSISMLSGIAAAACGGGSGSSTSGGSAGGIGQLTRAAAGDLYPPEHRARGIAYVMFGAVFGAILGPAVFAPLFRGRELSPHTLAAPWFGGAILFLVALSIVANVRPDPKRIAEMIDAGRHPTRATEAPAASLSELLRRHGVVPAMLAGVFSFAIMSSVMNLAGYVVVEHRHHAQHLVFPIIGAHVVGMYLLMPVVGWIVDRVGHARTLGAGLVVIALSTAGLTYFTSVAPIALMLFGLGLGWNVSFVSATTRLADLAAPWERGKLLGFNDLVASLMAAVFVLLGGYVLDDFGVAALAIGASLVALAPIAFIRGVAKRQGPVVILSREAP